MRLAQAVERQRTWSGINSSFSPADPQSRLFQWPSPAKQIPDKQRENAHRLIDVLHRLVEEGHTVVFIEHPMAIAAEADWIFDIGSETGGVGDEIVA